MADLYERLVELQEVTKILVSDVEQLRPHLGEREDTIDTSDQEEANRRFYVRAIFALIDALIEQHKQLLLDLNRHGKVALGVDVAKDLHEKKGYLPLKQKLPTVCKAAVDAFVQDLNVSFEDQDEGWKSFQQAVEIRNRLTHPKSSENLYVSGYELEIVDQAHTWFRDFHNKFIRVACVHRKQNRW